MTAEAQSNVVSCGPSASTLLPPTRGPALPPSLPGPAVLRGGGGSICLNIAICVKKMGRALLAPAKTITRSVYKKQITQVVYGKENWCLGNGGKRKTFCLL